jgi:glycosyltransferase involved in cell wall biosynthesis
VLDDRRTAMLVPPRNPAVLAHAITDLADTPELRRSLVREARVQVLDQITWKTYAENMLRTFEQVLGERRSYMTARREAFA